MAEVSPGSRPDLIRARSGPPASASFAAGPRSRWSRLTALLLLLAACASFDPESAARYPTPRRGIVVSPNPIASRVGRDVLERGGNAADAAIATALALAVVRPDVAGLGGGGIALWTAHDATQAPLLLDFLVTAPSPWAAAVPGVGAAAGTPGTPAGLWALHQRVGVLPFRDLSEPALRLARSGFPIDEALAGELSRALEAGRIAADTGEFVRGGEALEADPSTRGRGGSCR